MYIEWRPEVKGFEKNVEEGGIMLFWGSRVLAFPGVRRQRGLGRCTSLRPSLTLPQSARWGRERL